jgi:hypothetical protein
MKQTWKLLRHYDICKKDVKRCTVFLHPLIKIDHDYDQDQDYEKGKGGYFYG